MSYRERKQRQVALRTDLENYDWTVFVNLVMNQVHNSTGLTKKVGKLMAMVERKLSGPNYQTQDRIDAFFTIEGSGPRIHCHGILIMNKTLLNEARIYFTKAWKLLAPAGSLEMECLNTKTDQQKVINYVCKKLYEEESFDSCFWASDFWP